MLNLACIAGALVVVDGPFLQRASSVITAQQRSNATLDINLPPELPTGFTGAYDKRTVWETSDSMSLMVEYIDKSPMFIEAKGCKGSVRKSIVPTEYHTVLD